MKIKKIIPKILYFCLVALVAFIAIKVAMIIIVTPILSFYGAAYNFYSISGDASYFKIAADATQTWLKSILALCLGLLLIKLIKIKRRIERIKSIKIHMLKNGRK